MKSKHALVVVALGIFLMPVACAPKPEPAIDQAIVVARNASVRQRNSSTSRTLVTLNPGDKVEILEHQDNWYRIRRGDLLQGWMEESTIVTNATNEKIREMVAASQSQQPQNTAVLSEEANFRIEPGRSTAIIRRLDSGIKMEILDRVSVPKPGSDTSFEPWLKARPSPTEVGWVIGSLVSFDVPSELAQYTEGYAYTAVKTLNQVQDPIAGPINWYVVGEKRPGLDPQLDFDGVRVFTWNLKMHRYETAFRARAIRGVYPLEVGQNKGNPTFRYFELGDDNRSKTPKEYVMYGVVTRPLTSASDSGQEPSRSKAARRPARRR